jgi:C1A family cysteine protease
MALRQGEILIDHSTPIDVLFMPRVDGEMRARGLVPRNYLTDPEEMFAAPSEIPKIDKGEWSDRIKEMEATESLLSHVRLRGNGGKPIPSLDQGQVGYCWAHSTTHTVMMDRAKSNQPYVPLSAYAVAATIKKGKDEGGWCGLSAKFWREKGGPSQSLWPQGDRDYRKYDKPEIWANAQLHMISEDFVDLTRSVYDQNLTFEQVICCLLARIPLAVDFNWWGHSVCALDPVEVEAGSFGIRILNSWSDKWGDQGMSVLRGEKAIPNSCVATRVTGVAVA